MATITAIGPALALNGPLPEPPEYSLLAVPDVLQQNGDRWMNGVNVYGYPSDPAFDWEPCSTGTNRVKVSESDQPLPRFDAFALYVPIACSAMSIGNWDDFAGRAELVLQATQSFAVEKALSQGVQFSSNPFLGDSNVQVLAGGAAVSPVVALAYLEDAIGATGRQGMIHMTPGVAGFLGFNLLHTEADEAGEAPTLETVNGTTVATGGGYIGATANGAAAGSGNAWAFATGPVQVYLSDVQRIPPEIMQSLDTANNDVLIFAEKYALVIWDGALQAAVKVDYTP